MVSQLIGTAVATDDMIGLHWVDVSGRHSGEEGGEDDGELHDC